MRIGFHASHEQISPRQLLLDVQHAERAGFQMAMCSDHFAPWSERQGHSGYTWSWLGSALATTSLTFGTVSAPGQRYHPAVLAQKIATLGQMFPGRIWTALASGEAINESITGERWPRKEVRVQRLEESVGVIRRLLAGEEVTHDGLISVDRARIWDLPEEVPQLIGPAISPASAARVAKWANGLITANQDHETLRRVVAAYREAGGRGPLALQVHLSWAEDVDEAERLAHEQWRSNMLGAPLNWDVDSTAAFDAGTRFITREQVHSRVRISEEPAQHAEWISEYAEMGFEDIYLHHVGQDQQRFIDVFGEQVIPQFA
ncbi:MAG TPA: TIGR03885 family FMN-dependent LLM class oxidoreductase [Actinomycetales bacterium]|nr:TIGR03885 family FMN-dependent LLM class oxidoreductase [Actinomycetales bacterium]